jgi:hypothetical protein
MSFLHSSPILNRIVVLSAAQIASPTATQLADYSVTYMLDEAPYTRYVSNGTNLLQIAASVSPTPVDQMLFTGYTEAQLTAQAAAGTLTQYASYVPSDTGQKFWAPDDSSLQFEETLFVYAASPQFGGYWDGTNNDSVALQDAIDYSYNAGKRQAVMLPLTTCWRDPIYMPEGVYLVGYNYRKGLINTNIKIHADANFSATGYALNMNTTNGTTPTVAPRLGQWYQCGAFGLWFNNSTPVSLPGMRFMLIAGTYYVDDIRGYLHTQLIKKLAGQYIDNGKIGTVFAASSYDNSEYGIDIGSGGGDGLEIGPLNFPAATTPELAVKVSNGRCRVTSAINGSLYFVNCPKVEVLSHHAEHCKIVAENTNLVVRSAEWQMATASAATDYPITMTNTTGDSNTQHTLELDDVAFAYGNGSGASEGKINGEIAITFQAQVKLRNARRRITEQGAQQTLLGVRFVKQSDNTALTELNRWAHILSDEGVIVGNVAQFATSGLLSAVSDFSGITASNQITSPSGDLANTTYYYTTQLLLDNKAGALLGRNQTSAEKSQATGGANRRLGLTVGYGSCSSKAILRVYRGTSAGSYGFYVDLPVMKGSYIVDQGTYCCGVPWIDRGGASAVTAITDTTQGNYLITPNDYRQPNRLTQAISSAAAPAVNCAKGTIITLTASNATVTFAAPSNVPRTGSEVTFILTQDGTGGRTIAWDAAYIFPTAWSNTGNTASKVSSITFKSDGTKLVAQGANSWY